MTNRGWSSLGSSYGLVRVRWSGQTPFEIKEMRAKPNGFELIFTQPVDTATALNKIRIFYITTLRLLRAYGSTTDKQDLAVSDIKIKDDHLSVAEGLKPHYVHELHAKGIRNQNGEPLLHPEAYYTLNQIPEQ